MARAPGLVLHANCVALGAAGLLIRGASGTGKSALSLELMARGAQLVADDRTCLRVEGGLLVATSPEAIAGRIEARGLGILRAQARARAVLAAVVDLGIVTEERLPPWQTCDLLGVRLPLIHAVRAPHFAAALVQYLKAGRTD